MATTYGLYMRTIDRHGIDLAYLCLDFATAEAAIAHVAALPPARNPHRALVAVEMARDGKQWTARIIAEQEVA